MPIPEPPPPILLSPSVSELRALLQSFKNDDLSTLSSLQYVLAVLLDYTYNLPVSSGISELTGDVTAGPGSNSQIATVTGLSGNPIVANSPVLGDTLVWDGSAWVSSTPATTGITELNGDVVAGPGTGIQNATVAGIEGVPVDATSPTLGQVLAYNGVWWTPTTLPADAGITELTGDVTAGPGSGSQSSTVTKLQGNDVSSISPNDGQVLTWNGTAWVPGAPAAGGSGGGGQVYFLNFGTAAESPVANLPGTPKELGLVAEILGSSVTSSNLPFDGSYLLVAGFVTKFGSPDLDTIPAGIWDFNVWAQTNVNQENTTIFRLKVYKYDGINAPILLAIGAPTPLYNPTQTIQYVSSVVLPQTPISTTDRVYVEIEAKATSSGHTITVSFGDGAPSHVHTTLPSIAGTGIVHVINGVVQSPASPVDLSAGASEISGVLPVINGGVGTSTVPLAGDILVGTGSAYTPKALTAGTGVAITNGPTSVTIDNTGVTSIDVSGGTTGLTFLDGPVTTTGTITMTGTLGVSNGGTGLTSTGLAGNILVSNGTALTSVPVSKDATLNSTGELTVTGIQGTQLSSTAPANGQLLQYNSGTGQWTPTNPQSVLQTTYTAIYATENINRGDVVVAVNAGGSPAGYVAVAKASALTADLSFPVVGISNDNLTTATPQSRLGNAVITGLIFGIDTHLLTQRRPAFISSTTPGGLTSTKPSNPNYVFQVGYCIDQSGAAPPFTGAFWVSPQSIIDTKNLSDVTASAPAENDLLIYKSATSLWTSAPLLKVAQTQTAVNLNAGNTITNAMIAGVLYLPIRTNSAITLGANPIDVLTSSDYGRVLWLHNVSTGGGPGARNITLLAGGTTWLEGGVNLVLPANTIAKFMWLNVGGGAGRWVQTDKAVTAS